MDVNRLAQLEEITLRTTRRDGTPASRPIWIVAVDGTAYVRAVFGTRTAWYRGVRRDPRVELSAGDDTLPAVLEPVSDAGLDDRVSDAYRAKYAASWPADTDAIVGDEARASTLRVRVTG
jgi:hypothetical protein